MISPEPSSEGTSNEDSVLQKPPRQPSNNAWETSNAPVARTIPITSYQEYFEAIIVNDVETVKRTLKSEKDTSLLVNCCFDFEHTPEEETHWWKRVTHPFHLAVGSQAKKVAEILLQHGCNPESQDAHGRNVLHSISVLSNGLGFSFDAQMAAMVPWLIETIGFEAVYRLSRQENNEGLRPVESAAQMGALNMMKVLLETKDLYVIDEGLKGDTRFLDLDVTEYESGKRHAKSPLNTLAYLDKSKMQDPDTANVILSPVILSWLSAKKMTNIIPVLLWFLFRLLVIGIFIVADINVDFLIQTHGENASHFICEDLALVQLESNYSNTLVAILTIAVLTSLTLIIAVFIRDRVKGLGVLKHHCKGSKTLASNTTFYQLVEIFYILCMLTGALVYYIALGEGYSEGMILAMDIVRLTLPIFMVWLLIYFFQLIPYLGSFIISVQGMVGDMLQFCLFFLFIIFPFAHAFETFVHSNSKEGCIDAFSNPIKTTYTLFLMMLNMYNLSDHDIQYIGALYVMHVIFVFFVAVLLLNFLIAIMSSSASRIADYGRVLLVVNQIAIINECERFSFWARGWFYPFLLRLGFDRSPEGQWVVRFVNCHIEELNAKRSDKK